MALEDIEFARALTQRFDGLRAVTSVFKVWVGVARDLFDHLRDNLDLADLVDQTTIVTSSVILEDGDHIILVDNNTNAALTVTLPDLGKISKVHVWIKDIGGDAGTYDIVLDPGTNDIDGVSGAQTAIDTDYGYAHYYSDGYNWHLLNESNSTAPPPTTDTQRVELKASLLRAVHNVQWLGHPPTSAVPLVVSDTGVLDELGIVVNDAATVPWTLEVINASTLSVLATLTLPISQKTESAASLNVAVTAGTLLEVKLSGAGVSSFRRGEATVTIIS